MFADRVSILVDKLADVACMLACKEDDVLLMFACRLAEVEFICAAILDDTLSALADILAEVEFSCALMFDDVDLISEFNDADKFRISEYSVLSCVCASDVRPLTKANAWGEAEMVAFAFGRV